MTLDLNAEECATVTALCIEILSRRAANVDPDPEEVSGLVLIPLAAGEEPAFPLLYDIEQPAPVPKEYRVLAERMLRAIDEAQPIGGLLLYFTVAITHARNQRNDAMPDLFVARRLQERALVLLREMVAAERAALIESWRKTLVVK